MHRVSIGWRQRIKYFTCPHPSNRRPTPYFDPPRASSPRYCSRVQTSSRRPPSSPTNRPRAKARSYAAHVPREPSRRSFPPSVFVLRGEQCNRTVSCVHQLVLRFLKSTCRTTNIQRHVAYPVCWLRSLYHPHLIVQSDPSALISNSSPLAPLPRLTDSELLCFYFGDLSSRTQWWLHLSPRIRREQVSVVVATNLVAHTGVGRRSLLSNAYLYTRAISSTILFACRSLFKPSLAFLFLCLFQPLLMSRSSYLQFSSYTTMLGNSAHTAFRYSSFLQTTLNRRL